LRDSRHRARRRGRWRVILLLIVLVFVFLYLLTRRGRDLLARRRRQRGSSGRHRRTTGNGTRRRGWHVVLLRLFLVFLLGLTAQLLLLHFRLRLWLGFALGLFLRLRHVGRGVEESTTERSTSAKTGENGTTAGSVLLFRLFLLLLSWRGRRRCLPLGGLPLGRRSSCAGGRGRRCVLVLVNLLGLLDGRLCDHRFGSRHHILRLVHGNRRLLEHWRRHAKLDSAELGHTGSNPRTVGCLIRVPTRGLFISRE
jgi:hypothetical protein